MDWLFPLLQSKIDLFMVVAFMAAWFAQMGLHEGAHAYVADRLGDPIPRAMGKVTFNPFKHIEWNNNQYVIYAVVMPLITTLMGWIPMGMAWVMHSRMDPKSEAKIAIAGPIGSFAVAVITLVIWYAIYPFMLNMSPGVVEALWKIAKAFVLTSILYGAFNLFPIPPLDGGTVAYHFMNQEGRRIMDQIRPYGFMVLIGLFWILGIGDPLFAALFEGADWAMAKGPRLLYG